MSLWFFLPARNRKTQVLINIAIDNLEFLEVVQKNGRRCSLLHRGREYNTTP